MIMSHQADLVDGCGAGGRPSDYLSSSLSKGTSQCEPQTHVEMLRFLRLLSVKMLIVKIVDCRVLRCQGRPSDYHSSSLSKGTSHTYVEMLIFVRLIMVKMLIVKIVQCKDGYC